LVHHVWIRRGLQPFIEPRELWTLIAGGVGPRSDSNAALSPGLVAEESLKKVTILSADCGLEFPRFHPAYERILFERLNLRVHSHALELILHVKRRLGRELLTGGDQRREAKVLAAPLQYTVAISWAPAGVVQQLSGFVR